ncbi:DUF6479 family protein [Streptomyces litmocidini]|uniref:DUF6479 family protein n=1 Tax=Streptomyces litmocidini TaxID=67318 RepID=UPI0036F754ED
MTGIAASSVLASAGSNAVLFAVGLGIVVVALLVGAFWWGSRRAARRRRSDVDPLHTDAGAKRESWTTPEHPDHDGSGR